MKYNVTACCQWRLLEFHNTSLKHDHIQCRQSDIICQNNALVGNNIKKCSVSV